MGQVRLFSEKLRSKGRTDVQIAQAAAAVSLFFAVDRHKHALSSRGSHKRVCSGFLQRSIPTASDIRTIQTLLGHSDVRTTMIYTHCVPSRTLKELKSPLDF